MECLSLNPRCMSRLSTTSGLSESSVSHRLNDVQDVQDVARMQQESKCDLRSDLMVLHAVNLNLIVPVDIHFDRENERYWPWYPLDLSPPMLNIYQFSWLGHFKGHPPSFSLILTCFAPSWLNILSMPKYRTQKCDHWEADKKYRSKIHLICNNTYK